METITDITTLVEVKQLPLIEEQLVKAKTEVMNLVAEANSLVCTAETAKSVKDFRTELRRQANLAEDLRKQIKKQIMEPYERFEQVYNENVKDPIKQADAELSRKINSVESELKANCEKQLRDYFSELCTTNGVDFIRFEQSGVEVTLTMAKKKSFKSEKEMLTAFVEGVKDDATAITTMENGSEILVEYKKSLSISNAVQTVTDRHKAIQMAEEERARREAAQKAEEELKAQQQVAIEEYQRENPDEVLFCIEDRPAEPEPEQATAATEIHTEQVNEVNEKKLTLAFKVSGTKAQLIGLKQYLLDNNIEIVKD